MKMIWFGVSYALGFLIGVSIHWPPVLWLKLTAPFHVRQARRAGVRFGEQTYGFRQSEHSQRKDLN